MAQQIIKYGDFAGDTNPATTELARESFRKAKENFTELYSRPVSDMNKSQYDTDNSGVVDSAEKVSGIDAAGNLSYYGKNASGTIGFYTFPVDKVDGYADFIDFPSAGFEGVIYIDQSAFILYLWDDVNEVYSAVAGGVSQGYVDDGLATKEPLNVPPIADTKVKVYNLDGSVTYEDYGGGSSGATPITKPFTYTGGVQEFTVDTPIIKPDYILVGNTSLQLTQFTWAGSKFTITDTLTVGAVIEIGYWDDTAVIGSVSSKSDKTIQITGVSLATSGWILVGSFFEYNYANAGITANKIVDVIPDKSTIDIVQASEILPETLSGAGTVKFYAKNLPTATILVTINIEE